MERREHTWTSVDCSLHSTSILTWGRLVCSDEYVHDNSSEESVV